MNSASPDPGSPPVSPSAGTPPVIAAEGAARWRKILWSLFAIMVVAPLAWVFGLNLTGLLLYGVLAGAWRSYEETLALLVPSIIALLAAWQVVRLGLRRNWPGRPRQLARWGVAAVGIAAIVAAFTVGQTKVRESSKLGAMLPRQPAGAIAQFYFESPNRIFVKYDELVGPDRLMRGFNPVDGEDLRVQFPVRQGWCEPLPVRLPDGTTVQRLEVLAAIGTSGLIATYPRPQDDQYDRERVYRLDCGVSFRDGHVVDLPPDPAGREGRDQDGVHTYQFPDGRRFEITYRSGVPDGPFRAYHADGAPWGEATYRRGRVVEAWLITRDGKRFDELKDGDAANAAVTAQARKD